MQIFNSNQKIADSHKVVVEFNCFEVEKKRTCTCSLSFAFQKGANVVALDSPSAINAMCKTVRYCSMLRSGRKREDAC